VSETLTLVFKGVRVVFASSIRQGLMMKHLMFVTNFLPHVGGLEYYVDDLSKTLKKYWNDEIHIVCFDDKESISEFNGIYSVHRIKRVASVAGVFAIPNPFSLFRVIRNLRLRVGNVDMVWTHTRFFVSAILGLFYAKLFRLKSLHIEHGSSYVAHSNPVIRFCSRAWDQVFGRSVLSFSEQVVVVSPKGIDFTSALGAKSPSFIPAGIDVNLWRPSVKFFEIPERPIILYVGRLLPGKGLDLLLHAFNDDAFAHCTLLIAGDGPSRTRLELLAKELDLGDRVKFLGSVQRTELFKLYGQSSLFVNPSHSEGGPLTVLEALACGTAVVSTHVGCVQMYLQASGNHGVLTDEVSVEALRKGLTLGLKAFKVQNRLDCSGKIEDAFSWHGTAQSLRNFGLKHRE